MKAFCRGAAFLLTGMYTAMLISKIDAGALIYIPIAVGIGICAAYGWEK